MTARAKMAGRTERPVIFSAPMVRAILEGRKTQTRRIFDPIDREAVRSLGCDEERDEIVFQSSLGHAGPGWYVSCGEYPDEGSHLLRCRYGAKGDSLWVRETFCVGYPVDARGKRYSAIPWTGADEKRDGKAFYAADRNEKPHEPKMPWRPSIYMPRWASRLTLSITKVRAERLHSLSEEDATSEGVVPTDEERSGHPTTPHRQAFYRLWQTLNAKRAPWISNPWVWVIEFQRAAATSQPMSSCRGA